MRLPIVCDEVQDQAEEGHAKCDGRNRRDRLGGSDETPDRTGGRLHVMRQPIF